MHGALGRFVEATRKKLRALFGKGRFTGPATFPVEWITSHIAAGPAPLGPHQLRALQEQGVNAILNVAEELESLAAHEQEAGFEVRFLPIEDDNAPNQPALDTALDWLDEAVWRGRRVYVHCRYGHGRTGTVLHAYLVRRGFSVQEAERTLAAHRPTPTSYAQWKALRGYARDNRPLQVRPATPNPVKLHILTPLLAAYATLVRSTDARIHLMAPGAPRCGIDNADCCTIAPVLPLAEAAAMTDALDRTFSAERREALRAAATAAVQGPCPLLDNGTCLLSAGRPLRCRAAHLAPEHREELYATLLDAPMKRLDEQAFTLLAGCPPAEAPPCFPLAEVISGRYVATLFRTAACMMRKER